MKAKLKILIVDDNERLCSNLSDILSVKGYEVIVAFNGSQAINLVQEQKINVVLLDVKMPGISGIETLKILKQIRKDIVIIMITAFADEIFYKQGLSEGDYEVIQKPINIDKLLSRLEEFKVKRKKSVKRKALKK